MATTALFGPWHVDSSFAGDSDDEIRVSQLAVEVLVGDELPIGDPVDDPDGGGTVPDGTDPATGVSICNEEVPLAWWEIEESGGTIHRYAKVPINIDDPIEPRAESLGRIRRSLSSTITGAAQGSQVAPVFIDHDRFLRGREGTDSLVNCRASAYVSTPTAIRNNLTPRRVYDGRVTDSEPLGGLKFRVEVTDFLAILLDKLASKTFPLDVFDLETFANMGNPESDPVSPGNPTMVGKPMPVGYGPLSDESAASPAGVVPGIYTGKTTLPGYGGFLFDEYIFFRHAPSPGDHVLFVPEGPGLSVGTEFPSRVRITASSGVAEYVFYGTPQWDTAFGPGAPNFVTKNGKPFTAAYAFGPRSDLNRTGQVPLVANIPGIEADGDGTGLMITSLFQQILHALVNWFLPDTPYESGAWLSAPTVGAGADLYSLIYTDSFGDLQTYSGTVMGTAEGFLGAWMMGGLAPTYTLASFLETAARNACFRYGLNRNGQVFGSMLNPNAPLVRAVSDVTDVLKGTFRAKRRRQEIRNVCDYRYQRRYVPAFARATPAEDELLPRQNTELTTEWAVDQQQYPPDVALPTDSTAKYGERREDLSLELIRDPDTADAVAQLTILEREGGPIVNGFTEGPCGTLIDLGDRIELDHFEGMTAVGYVARSMQCEVHELDLDSLNVDMEHRDLTALEQAT